MQDHELRDLRRELAAQRGPGEATTTLAQGALALSMESGQANLDHTLRHEYLRSMDEQDVCVEGESFASDDTIDAEDQKLWTGNVRGTLVLTQDWRLGDCVMEKGATITVSANGSGRMKGNCYTKRTRREDIWHAAITWKTSEHGQVLAGWPRAGSSVALAKMTQINRLYPFDVAVSFDASNFSRFGYVRVWSKC